MTLLGSGSLFDVDFPGLSICNHSDHSRDGGNSVSDIKSNIAPDNILSREKELMNLERDLKRRESVMESRFRELKEREQELEKRKAAISEVCEVGFNLKFIDRYGVAAGG